MPDNGREKFLSAVEANKCAIALCIEYQLWLPSLVLVYTAIDSMAWLIRDRERKDATHVDFEAWCSDYLLKSLTFDCSPVDIYAARCSILHSYTSESKLVREGKAMPLWYELPNGKQLIPISSCSAKMATIVRLKPFVNSFEKAVRSFVETVSADSEHASLVWARADLYFDSVRSLNADGGAPPPNTDIRATR